MAKKNQKSGKIISWVFGGIGLIFFLVGGGLTYTTYGFMENSQPTTGQVISVDTNYSDDGVSYRPTFSFVDVNGNRQQGATFLSSSSYNFAVGSKVDILYDQRDPSSVRLTGWFDTWGFGLIFMVIGGIPMLIAFFIRKRAGTKLPVQTSDPIRDKYVRLESPETAEDHARETNYTPTVRRRR
ncbi:MAG: DUF3592 domain-containing protein [Rhodobacteraceae bacterium]|nr:DUF3592 domain-containing protein [Paracoccaceae bacterium]